jgi:hypothetical protein
MNQQQDLTDIKPALRVLSALTANRHPDPSDIEALRNYADQQANAALNLDELACTVIHQALKHRAEVLEHLAWRRI